MDLQLYVASKFGLHIFSRRDGEWEQTGGAFEEKHVTSVTSHDPHVLIGTTEGIYRSSDRGQSWWEAGKGLTESHVRWLAYHPTGDGRAYAGTEPAAIFFSKDGGRSWTERPEVTRLREAHNWSLPYSPNAGCVRGFAFHGERGCAAVEQGGLLRTDDGGRLWKLAPGSTGETKPPNVEDYIHPDVHSVKIHPSSKERVFAPTGGGLYYSTDGGRGWERLYRCYTRAVWLDPDDQGHVIFGPADGVDSGGRIEETINNGETWTPAMAGLDKERWTNHMVERFLQIDDELLAVLSNGQLLVAPLESLTWRSLLPTVQDVTAVAALKA